MEWLVRRDLFRHVATAWGNLRFGRHHIRFIDVWTFNLFPVTQRRDRADEAFACHPLRAAILVSATNTPHTGLIHNHLLSVNRFKRDAPSTVDFLLDTVGFVLRGDWRSNLGLV